MVDFKNPDPNTMNYKELAEKAKMLKETEGDEAKMCAITEQWFNDGKAEGIAEGIAEGEARGKAEGCAEERGNVDVESIIDDGVWKGMVFSEEIAQMFDVGNPLVSSVAQMVKPAFVSQMAAEVKRMIRHEFLSEKKGNSHVGLQRNLTDIGMMVSHITEEGVYGNDAMVSFILSDRKGESVKFRCRMEKIANGEWAVKEIVNFEEIIGRCIQSEILNAQMNMSR